MGLRAAAQAAAPPAAGPTKIAYGDSQNGRLDSGDSVADDDSFYDVYRFLGVEGERVVITMRSSDVDAYLSLHMTGTAEEIAATSELKALYLGSEA